ncbi:bifunctional 3-(3-hydroxy-phenyl)propionate/3-hydroxycinnamic acid hydroxylase [Streptomyces sp. NPDC046465]|uniref:bifunctional 3-(3-hydroxy-phenyl)propionate/3-hydroxycinnamic acid hydroxylase MhpA n=1 Tax=Streptomyces sp. NPDC046465 TaxID=3155810 RepID=UPI0033F2DACF
MNGGTEAVSADGADLLDVLVVGAGPVGLVTAILLAQQGRRVTVLERWPRPYPMPRAVSFDGESARILAAAGVGDFIDVFGESSRDYTWRNGEGTVLFHVDVDDVGRSGWPDSTSMYQPALEEALAARAESLPGLRILRGHEVVDLADSGDRVSLTVQGPEGRGEFTARWVIGCDGANSFVRGAVSVGVKDLGFSNDWLTCDVILHGPREFRPNNLQVCDPARPRTEVSAGPGHRRWEFMRVPGESAEAFGRTENAWKLLDLFGITPGNATLERHAVYTFQARYATEWRVGRVLLAGDAAHLMPPFAGQGMCSGFRDAANLAWKLGLVLGGRAAETLLDTYTTERSAHVQHAITMSMELGRIICQTDPKAAKDRDTIMIATRERGLGRTAREPAVQKLTGGLLHRDSEGAPIAPAGELGPQGRVVHNGRAGRFDEIIGPGFTLFTTEPVGELIDCERLRTLAQLGVRTVRLIPDGVLAADGADVTDEGGVHLDHLTRTASRALLVRPDFYVYGAADDAPGLAELVDGLVARLMAAAAT